MLKPDGDRRRIFILLGGDAVATPLASGRLSAMRMPRRTASTTRSRSRSTMRRCSSAAASAASKRTGKEKGSSRGARLDPAASLPDFDAPKTEAPPGCHRPLSQECPIAVAISLTTLVNRRCSPHERSACLTSGCHGPPICALGPIHGLNRAGDGHILRSARVFPHR